MMIFDIGIDLIFQDLGSFAEACVTFSVPHVQISSPLFLISLTAGGNSDQREILNRFGTDDT